MLRAFLILLSLAEIVGCSSGSSSGPASLYPAHTGYSKPQGTFTIQEVLDPETAQKYDPPCERGDNPAPGKKAVSIDSRLKEGMTYDFQKTLVNFTHQSLKSVMHLEIASVDETQIKENTKLISGPLELFGRYSLAPKMDPDSVHCTKDENGKNICINVEGDLKATPIGLKDFSHCNHEIKVEKGFAKMMGTAYAFGGTFKIANGPTLRAIQYSDLQMDSITCDGQDLGDGFFETMLIRTNDLPHYEKVEGTCTSTLLFLGNTLALKNDQIQDQDIDEIISFTSAQ